MTREDRSGCGLASQARPRLPKIYGTVPRWELPGATTGRRRRPSRPRTEVASTASLQAWPQLLQSTVVTTLDGVAADAEAGGHLVEAQTIPVPRPHEFAVGGAKAVEAHVQVQVAGRRLGCQCSHRPGAEPWKEGIVATVTATGVPHHTVTKGENPRLETGQTSKPRQTLDHPQRDRLLEVDQRRRGNPRREHATARPHHPPDATHAFAQHLEGQWATSQHGAHQCQVVGTSLLGMIRRAAEQEAWERL